MANELYSLREYHYELLGLSLFGVFQMWCSNALGIRSSNPYVGLDFTAGS